MKRNRPMIRHLRRILALTTSLIGVPIPSAAADDATAYSLTIDDFCRLPAADQKCHLKKSFNRRLQVTENIRYEARLRGRTYKYRDGRVGEITHDLNGRNYRHWRLGNSYRIESEKGGAEVLNPVEFGNSGFDSCTGVVTSTVRFASSPRIFARIGFDHDVDIREDRYAYWLDGKPDKMGEADYLIRDLVGQFDEYIIEAPVEQDKVRLTIPWQPVWSGKPIGTRQFILDPGKGFLPIRGTAYCKLEETGGEPMWRSEDFSVGASRSVRDVWMPTNLKELIRASSTGEDHIVVWETDVTKIESGTVTATDLAVPFLAGTEVVDAIRGVSYVVGPGGEQAKLQPLVGPK
jgi:hypothetical protein